MRRASPWLAAIFFLGCLGLGYAYLYRVGQIARAAVEGDANRREADKQMAILRRQLNEAKSAQSETGKQAATLQTASEGASAQKNVRVVRLSDVIKDHPEYAAFREKAMRRDMMRQYGAVLAGLNLSPENLAKLKDLLTEREEGNADARQAAEAAGLAPGSAEQAIQQASQDLQQQITAVLQTSTTLNWQQLQAWTGFESQVQYTYGPDLIDAGQALTPAQSQGLVEAMTDANYSGKDMSQRPAGYNTRDATTGLTPHENQILANASQVLTPEQLQVVKADQIENAQQAAIYQQYSSGGPVKFVP